MLPAPRSLFRVVAALVAALAVLTGGLLVAAPAAQAVDTASISGTILDTAAAPIEGAGVSVYKFVENSPLTLAGNAVSDVTGAYTVSALPAGDYTVLFTAGGYASQYFDGSPSLDVATFITLVDGQARTGTDAMLSHAGSVTGTITNGSGDPEPNLYVEAMKLMPGGTYTSAGSAYTGSDGGYLVDGLPAGVYTLQLQGGGPAYPAQYLGGSTTVAGSSQFTLAEGQNKLGVDGVVALTPSDGATVSGTVTRASSGLPMLNAIVTAYAFDAIAGWQQVKQTVTAADGTYSFTQLEPGSYRFGFQSVGYTTQFWNGAANLVTATSIVLTTQTVTAVDASMADAVLTATVSGTIAIGSGAASPLDVHVDVMDRTLATVVSTGDTEADGSYSIDGLLPGTYTLRFHREGTVPVVKTQYLGGGVSLPAAQTFTVVAAQVKTLNVTLKLASVTATTLSVGTRAYGIASTATVRVTAVGGTPTGAVTVKDGTKTVATRILVAGKVTVPLPKTLTVGTHRLLAVYAGTSGFFPSSAPARSLVVTKAKPTVVATLAKKTIRTSARGRIAITVKATGLVPTGSVVVKDGRKILKTVKLSNGKVTVTLPRLKKGKHKISVTYKGSATVASGSRTVTLTVTG